MIEKAREILSMTNSQDLRAGDGLYKSLFDGAAEIIVGINELGKLLFVNQAFLKELGYRSSTAKLMDLEDILPPAEKLRTLSVIARIIKGDRINRIKTVFITRRGREIPVEGSLNAQYRNGRLFVIWGIFRNTAEHTKAEEELKLIYEEQKARRFELEALKSLSDRLTNIFTIEEAVQSMSSYLNEVLPFSAVTYLIVNPAEQGGVIYRTYLKESIGQEFLDRTRYDIEKFLRRKTGAELKFAHALVKNADPKLSGINLHKSSKAVPESKLIFPLTIGGSTLGLIHIASSKPGLDKKQTGWLTDAMIVTFMLFIVRLQTLIRSQHSRIESLVESLSDGLIMYNRSKDIVMANPTALKFTGLKPTVARLEEFKEIFSDYDIAGMAEETMSVGETQHIEEAELNGRIYEMFFTPVKDNEHKIVNGAIIIHDITEQKEIERMKTEFVSIASHQLRTPMTGIKWFTKMLLDGRAGKLTAKQKDYLGEISVSSKRLIKLVNDLLQVSRIETGRKFRINRRLVPTKKLIRDVKDDVRALSQKRKVIIRAINRAPGVRVMLDALKIRQAWGNLIINAIKYSNPGQTVEFSCHSSGEEMIFSVKDKGMGIPPAQQERIFQRFFRADNVMKKETKGTGLGLYIAKSIVEAHGGKIWFDSEENKGTSFYFSLPMGVGKKKKAVVKNKS